VGGLDGKRGIKSCFNGRFFVFLLAILSFDIGDWAQHYDQA